MWNWLDVDVIMWTVTAVKRCSLHCEVVQDSNATQFSFLVTAQAFQIRAPSILCTKLEASLSLFCFLFSLTQTLRLRQCLPLLHFSFIANCNIFPFLPPLWVLALLTLCSLTPLLKSSIPLLVHLLAAQMTADHSDSLQNCWGFTLLMNWSSGSVLISPRLFYSLICPGRDRGAPWQPAAGSRWPLPGELWPRSPLTLLVLKHCPAHGCQEAGRGAKARWNFPEHLSVPS